MKNAKYVIIAVACICAICAGFFFFSQNQNETEKELTKIETVITKDLEKNYPKTPRAVMDFYQKIIMCYYTENPTDAELEKLCEQMRGLMDEDLLLVNPKDEYYASVKADIAKYKEENRKLFSAKVCSTNEVNKVLDDKGDGVVEHIAYVKTSYYMKVDGQEPGYTYQEFVLRQDENGDWKILVFYKIEGDESDDK